MEKMVMKGLATKVSLNELMMGVITDAYDFEDAGMLRIVSDLKPGFTILCVEADVSEDVTSFISNLAADPSYKGEASADTPFESTVYDFVVVSLQKHPETGQDTVMSMSLQELFTMNGVVERGAGDDDFGSLSQNDWSPEVQEWDMYELLSREQLLKEPEIPTDMHILG
jgi:hypothetical protein